MLRIAAHTTKKISKYKRLRCFAATGKQNKRSYNGRWTPKRKELMSDGRKSYTGRVGGGGGGMGTGPAKFHEPGVIVDNSHGKSKRNNLARSRGARVGDGRGDVGDPRGCTKRRRNRPLGGVELTVCEIHMMS